MLYWGNHGPQTRSNCNVYWACTGHMLHQHFCVVDSRISNPPTISSETNWIWLYSCAMYPDQWARGATGTAVTGAWHSDLVFWDYREVKTSDFYAHLTFPVRWNLQSCSKWQLLFPSKSYAWLPWLLQQNTEHPMVLPLTIDTNRAREIWLFAKMHRKSCLP